MRMYLLLSKRCLRTSRWRLSRPPRSGLDQDHATPIHQLRHHPMQLQLDPTHLPELLRLLAEIEAEQSLLDRCGIQPPPIANTSHHHRRTYRIATRLTVPPQSSGQPSASNSTDTSRPETETEDDGDVEMDEIMHESGAISGASMPERGGRSPDAAAATMRTTTALRG
ncbi:hypothetical protein QCA50_020589 [Cerrena zonata]|uniref:Uncharacterized protein n=1 Tax=Cerrena zonata TaxID=2478898 RepID=A0AAW0FBH0_9APHY